MITHLFLLFPLLLGAVLLYNVFCLGANYVNARKLGLPVVASPISPDNPLWLALQTSFSRLFRRLPFAATSFTRYCQLGWEFHDRFRTHLSLGDAWILVTPAKNWLYVANEKAVTEIFSRSRDFVRPVWMLETLSVFGPNISTVSGAPLYRNVAHREKAEGQDWQRQRKLTATPFNEQKSVQIWSEAIRQSSDMLQAWLSRSSDTSSGLTSTSEDTRTLALHVLAFVGFQRSYPFQSKSKSTFVDAKSMTYRDSLALILKNAIVVMVLPQAAFSIPFLPNSWKQIGWAIQSFREYMMGQLVEERRLVREGRPGTGTLVSNLVRAGEGAGDSKTGSLKPLSESEILGNIFVFNFAGHDTTAISMAYAMLLLVAHPEVQDWISEEVRFYLKNPDPQSWVYSEAFPRLKRCLAVLLETLRLYNPLPGTPKYTGAQPQSLTVNDHTYVLPADMLIVPNLQASHTHPRTWGSDSLTWRPQRWISGPADGGHEFGAETLVQPAKGTYFPWSEGARNCPGRKFAQVEFVAVVATLFRDHRADPVPRGGESLAAARQRVLDVVKDSNVELLLQMREPESVAAVWKRRG